MSKINQINRRLLELDGGEFQKLADHYLRKRGYGHINPLGSVTGSNKVRKGTPDTWIPLPNGKYVFVEHTTQTERVFEKMLGDLQKCFDESRTGVSVERIEEIVFCHVTSLEPKEKEALGQVCQQHGVNLSTYGIGPISYDLYEKFPGLAKDYLGIAVDTGQILPPEEFIAAHDRKKLATRLDTVFRFREGDMTAALDGLDATHLVVVYGRPGVGKTRFALECCARFKQINSEYEIRCVLTHGLDLFEDLRVLFSEPGPYLILVDDANRVNQFEYIIRDLQNPREGQVIKVIATVRDYAIDKVQSAMATYGERSEIALQPMTEQEIKELIEVECGIRHPLYVERIADIAQGNPRLAIMAANLAKKGNTLNSIRDVSSIYDLYFASITDDLSGFSDQNLLKAAGIIIFFRAVDRSNDEMMHLISEAFQISPDGFWRASRQLNSMEIVDLYENEVVKVSDQVLATYLFYLIFFRENALDIGTLLNRFFPGFRNRLVDALYPALNAFDSRMMLDKLRQPVTSLWRTLEKAGNEQDLLHLIETLGFVNPTDCLVYLRQQVRRMPAEPFMVADLKFEASAGVVSSPILDALSSFRFMATDDFRIALAILFDYLAKRPSDLPEVLYLLTERFGFHPISYVYGFSVQVSVQDVLWNHSRHGQDELFSRVFLSIVPYFLRTRFQITEARGRNNVRVITFRIPVVPELLELRRNIWSRLFQLYEVPALRKEVLASLCRSFTQRYWISDSEIVRDDSAIVLPFIKSHLDPGNLEHCIIAQEYMQFVSERGVEFDEALRQQFSSESHILYELLVADWPGSPSSEMALEEFEVMRNVRLCTHFEEYDPEDYKRFFEQCLEIQVLLEDHESVRFRQTFVEVLLLLAARSSESYAQVLEHYLGLGEPFRLSPCRLVEELIRSQGAELARQLLQAQDYLTKRNWMFAFLQLLPEQQVSLDHLDQLYALYGEAEPFDLPYDFDYLLKYSIVDSGVVARVVAMVLEKAGTEAKYGYALLGLFSPPRDAALTELLSAHLPVLKRAYLTVLSLRRHIDYSGRLFARILNADSGFVLEYVDHIYDRNDWYAQGNEARDFTFLWLRNDHATLMTRVIDKVYEREGRGAYGSALELFFTLKEGSVNVGEATSRQDRLLRDLISVRANDPTFIEFIFVLVAELPLERRRQFVTTFLEHNRNATVFRRLALEPPLHTWSGSAVPMLQGRVESFESLLPCLNTVDFLEHKQHVERQIEHLRLQIEREKKSIFMSD